VTDRPSRPSLLTLLTLPFLAVTVLLGIAVGVLSYRAAASAVEDAARLLLATHVQRIGDSLERQRAEADAMLRAAFPDGGTPPAELVGDLDGLTMRGWAALSLASSGGAALHYATAAGQLAVLRRLSAGDGQLSLQRAPSDAPDVVLVRAAGAEIVTARTARAAPRADVPVTPGDDVRHSAWYRAGQAVSVTHGLPAAVAPGGEGLNLWRVRRVPDGQGRLAGVAAIETSLKPTDDLLRALALPPRAVALVVDAAGQPVAQRGAPVVRRIGDGAAQRLSLREVASPAAAALVPRLLPQLSQGSLERPGSALVELPDGEPLLASYARIGADGGYPLAVIVAAPLGDFRSALARSAAHAAASVLVAVAVVLVAGAWVRRRLAGDALELVQSAQRIGDGDLETAPAAMASQELEVVSEALRRMQLRLRTDRISGLANRESVLTRLHDRMRPGRRHNDAPLLALLFVDLDRFKAVNDRHGHETGDFVLQTIGRRLRQTVRDTDLVARWSGDEFVLLLDGVGTPDNAHRVRDQVERVLRDPVELGPGREAVELDGTVGLALSPGDAHEPEALIRAAEEDMVLRKPSSESRW